MSVAFDFFFFHKCSSGVRITVAAHIFYLFIFFLQVFLPKLVPLICLSSNMEAVRLHSVHADGHSRKSQRSLIHSDSISMLWENGSDQLVYPLNRRKSHFYLLWDWCSMRTIPATVKVIKHIDTKGAQPCVKAMQGVVLVWMCAGKKYKIFTRQSLLA